MKGHLEICSDWYDKFYAEIGFGVLRLYPNEELARFIGREFISKKISVKERKNISILELGCGSCSNLWMVAKEGFAAYGIDISEKAIHLGKKMLKHWGVAGELNIALMNEIPYENEKFDGVYDIFSSFCLKENDFEKCLDEVKRVTKKGGKFFSYTPSTNSDAFKNHYPSTMIDDFTLDGIKRETSAFFGSDYPCRFISPDHYKELLEKRGFRITYLEAVSRTFHQMKEFVEYLTIVAEKE